MARSERRAGRSVAFLRAVAMACVTALALVITTIPLLMLEFVLPSRPLFAVWGRFGANVMLGMAGARLEVDGFDGLDDGVPRFYVGNHQSLLDIPALVRVHRGDVRFMAKDSLFRMPCLGWILRRFDFVPIDRSSARKAHQSLERMIERLKDHPVPFVVFPEGTRSSDDYLLPFKPGALKIAQRTGFPVVPFAVYGSRQIMCRGGWGVTPGVVHLAFSKPIAANEAASMTSVALSDRVRGAVEMEFARLKESSLSRSTSPCAAR